MGKIHVSAAPVLKTARYSDFKGVDFSQDASLVSSKRSPSAINLISDNGGNPVKRLGWRKLFDLETPVHNIWRGEVNGATRTVAHAGTKIYLLDETYGTSSVLRSNVTNAKGTGFFFRTQDISKLYILTGGEYLVYDGTNVKNVSDDAYIPTILISKNPAGGGTTYESINLIQPKRTESFLGNGTDMVYYLASTGISAVNEVKVRTASGWSTLTVGTDYSVDLTNGKVTFTAAHSPVVTGQDNILITYSKEIAGYAARIASCTIHALYGYNAINRVFLSGNPEYKSQDWYSEAYDPTYFPDVNYAVIGTGDTAIMGYLKTGKYLTIIKEGNNQDSTIFMRTGETVNNAIVFPAIPSIAGVGAVSKGCFATLGDEPMFLSRRGVYGVIPTILSSNYVARDRSFYVDKKLTAERNLEAAVATEWDGYYILSVNSRCYILDGRHKSSDALGNSDYLYECYYWENVPAACFMTDGAHLYFGTSDGRVCKFNSDAYGIEKYSDGATFEKIDGELRYQSGGSPVIAEWSTPNDDDGGVQYFKTLNKKGCLAVLSPFPRSSCKCYFIVDGNPRELIKTGDFDIFDWKDVEFERFTFSTNESPQEIYFNKKKKKYKRIQIVIRNDEINEGFGIHEIIKTFSIGNFSKNKLGG